MSFSFGGDGNRNRKNDNNRNRNNWNNNNWNNNNNDDNNRNRNNEDQKQRGTKFKSKYLPPISLQQNRMQQGTLSMNYKILSLHTKLT